MTGYTVLMLTDDSHLFRKLELILAHKGCRVLRDTTQVEGIHILQLDLILVQVSRKSGEELVVLKQVKRLHPQVRVVLCSRDGEWAFPLEVYQLDADDYLFIPCRLMELWRRVVACLRRPLEKSSHQAPASRGVHVNRALLMKSRQMLEYFRYNLGSSASTLKTLINAPDAGWDEKLMAKIHEVSARLEILQEMTDCFLRGISGKEAFTCSTPVRNRLHHSFSRV
ncbi:MAG: response regulator [Deltaproteobacteria bacterium]|nr:MAG: response regulator [Deltaproteobacteria bacterium]